MVAETEGNTRRGQDGISALVGRIAAVAGTSAYGSRMLGYAGQYGFRSLTSRIVILNAVGLMILTGGILYLNQFRQGLTEARVHSLMTQGQIIAAAVAASATVDTDAITIDPDRLLELQAGEEIAPAEEEISSLDFPIHPERVSPLLRHILSDANVTARIYDPDGILIVNSANLYGHGDILRFDLAPPEKPRKSWLRKVWRKAYGWVFRGNLPRQKKFKIDNGLEFAEITQALAGAPSGIVRANKKGEIIVNVAVPIKRLSAVFGVLVLSTKGGDIDGIVSAERWAIVRVFLVALFVAILMSILLAGTIAKPVHRLAVAAERVRRGVKKRV
ncbi:MAG: stimulus-sensing domain-containing protein, partial [Hyphomicrobiales bacterium]